MEICHEMLMTSKFHCFDKRTNLKIIQQTFPLLLDRKSSPLMFKPISSTKAPAGYSRKPRMLSFFTLPSSLPVTQRGLSGGWVQEFVNKQTNKQTNKNEYPLHTVKSNKQCIYSTELLYTWKKVKRILPPEVSISGHILPVL